MLRYKNYIGTIDFDEETMIFHGEVIGLKDVVTFRGSSPQEIKKEFESSIDGYLNWCEELGQEPEKGFTGNIHLRIQPDLHAKLAASANYRNVSLNLYIKQALLDLVI